MNIAKIVAALPPMLRRHKIVEFLLAISPDSRIQLVRFNGSAELFADISDQCPRNYLITGVFEPEFFSIAAPFLSRGGVFFDAGANFGFCSFGLMARLPDQTIEYHLFEANESVCRLLMRSASLHQNQRISVIHCCLTNEHGMSKLKIVPEELGRSFISSKGEQEVQNLILDEYISSHSISRVNLLKIDIEGMEGFALKGALNSFQRGIVDAVYVEISAENLARSDSRPEDCFSTLTSAGFDLYYCKPADFESGVARESEVARIIVNDQQLKLARLSDFPAGHQTDLLAIHRNSAILSGQDG